MKKLSRLVESSNSEVERLVLGVEREHPPGGAKGRALVAATGALAATTLAAGSAAGTGAAAAGAAGKGALGAKAASLVSLISLKWAVVVVGVAGAGVALGSVAIDEGLVDRVARRPVASESAPMAAAPPRPATPAAAAPAIASGTVEESVVASAPSAPLEVVHAPAPVAAPSASAGGTSAAELAVLDRARAVLADGEPARALSILDTYRARFPRGIMTPEASILRIEALVKAGDRPAAKRLADAFLQADPASPYSSRIASLLAASNR